MHLKLDFISKKTNLNRLFCVFFIALDFECLDSSDNWWRGIKGLNVNYWCCETLWRIHEALLSLLLMIFCSWSAAILRKDDLLRFDIFKTLCKSLFYYFSLWSYTENDEQTLLFFSCFIQNFQKRNSNLKNQKENFTRFQWYSKSIHALH